MNLDGKIALVTGASRGMGAAVAIALAEKSAKVAIAARSTGDNPTALPGTLEETAERIRALGGEALIVPTNLAKDEEVVAMVERTVEHFGRIDILINNAALAVPNDNGMNLTTKHFNLLMAVNTRAPMVASAVAARHMIKQGAGAIINVSSAAGVYRVPALTAYGMAKLALEHYTVMFADELAGAGVSVNCFRIDIGTASEGLLARSDDHHADEWEPPAVTAEGFIWILEQGPEYTGQVLSMATLRREAGVMKTRVSKPNEAPPGATILPEPLVRGHAPIARQ